MNPFPLRIFALIPLAFFGLFGVLMLSHAIVLAHHDLAKALVFAAIALLSTLGYPAMIDVERRYLPPPQTPRLPLKVYDLFFLGGGLFETWRLAPQIDPMLSMGIALLLWIIAAAAARNRAAELEGTLPKEKS